jgi:hypothetical protein
MGSRFVWLDLALSFHDKLYYPIVKRLSKKDSRMNTKSAIITFSQSEKVKAGLIWASQTVEANMGIPEPEKRGSEKRGSERIISALLNMIASEIHVVMKVAPHERWDSVMKHIDTAAVMVNSNVAHDATFHLSKALSQVTSIGHESMSLLTEKNLL